MKVKDIVATVDGRNAENYSLWFITRTMKSANARRSARIFDKYDFALYKVDIDDDLREALKVAFEEAIKFLNKDQVEIREYELFCEDPNVVLTYPIENSVESFKQLFEGGLPIEPIRITSLEEIVNSEQIWAYCISLESEDLTAENTLYAFKRLYRASVAISQEGNMGPNPKGILRKVQTRFNTTTTKLEIAEYTTVAIDRNIDCFLVSDEFYIRDQSRFESMIGLGEEYKSTADDLIKSLPDDLFEDVSGLEQLIADKPSFAKKLVRISRIGGIENLSADRVAKMKEVAIKYNLGLSYTDGKFSAPDKQSAEVLIKLLADWHKQGEVSGESYGTYSGSKIKLQS